MSAVNGTTKTAPVLFVAPPMVFSGVSLGCLSAAEALAARAGKPFVLTPYRGALVSGALDETAFSELPWLGYSLLARFAAPMLRGRLRRAGIRIVHAHGAQQIALGARLAGALGVPLVVSVYHFAPRGERGEPWIDWRFVSALTTFSDALKQDVINRRRAPRSLVRVVCAGVAAGEVSRKAFEAPGCAPVVGTLVEHEKPRSVEVFIEAMPRVLAHHPEAQFLIGVDDVSPQGAMRSAIGRLGLTKNVTITGVRELRRLLEVMDVCVLPAVEEGPCEPLLEALAAARPVVAGASGSAYSVVQDEVSGRLFPRRDAAALADAICSLLDAPDRARALGEAARKQVLASCSLERLGADLEELYARLGVAIGAAT